jgi:hypothetical protein
VQRFPEVRALTFDLFGTVLDLGGSLTPFIARFLRAQGSSASPQWFWDQWRARQRLEQYQDTMLMLGHSGYLETSRRALVYTLALGGIEASGTEVAEFMRACRSCRPSRTSCLRWSGSKHGIVSWPSPTATLITSTISCTVVSVGTLTG